MPVGNEVDYMAYQVGMNTDIPKMTALYSRNVELISAVHVLADSKHHEFAIAILGMILKLILNRLLVAEDETKAD